MNFLRDRRRKALKAKAFPEAWEPFLYDAPLFRFLSAEGRKELREHVQVFLAEKRFEGASGFNVTDRVKVTIAGNACLLLLHRKAEYFPFLRTIVVYPTLYVARYTRSGPGGIVEEGVEVRAGESWPLGTVVLAWDAVIKAGFGPGARNVVVHEFAHQLDLEDGAMQGVPVLPWELLPAWEEVFFGEYRRLRASPQPTPLASGLESPAEFFAVAVELFFSDPGSLFQHHPDLYGLLSRYFRQNPVELLQT